MRRRVTLLLLVAALLPAACAKDDSTANDGIGTIRGSVLLGPTCPVEQVSSPCPPRPLSAVRVEALDEHGNVRASSVSDSRGRFEMDIEPGSYTLTASIQDDPARSVRPTRVDVDPGEVVHTNVLVDSGIR